MSSFLLSLRSPLHCPPLPEGSLKTLPVPLLTQSPYLRDGGSSGGKESTCWLYRNSKIPACVCLGIGGRGWGRSQRPSWGGLGEGQACHHQPERGASHPGPAPRGNFARSSKPANSASAGELGFGPLVTPRQVGSPPARPSFPRTDPCGCSQLP